MKHVIFLVVACCLLATDTIAQTGISNSTAVIQNFDAMSTTNSLPSNWKIHASVAAPTYTGASTTVTQVATAGSPTAGGTYNFGATSTERSVGAMTSGGFASPNNLLGYYRNTGTNAITDLTISYDAERFRVNTAAASVQFFYSLNGSTWVSVTAGDIASSNFPTGTSSYTFSTPTVVTRSNIAISGLNIPANGDFYLRWNINTTGGNSQAIGIDNVSVTATFASGCTAPSTQISTLVASAPTSNGVSASWTSGSGDASLIVARPTSQSAAAPVSGTGYSANSDYSLAAQINSNNRVVYGSSGSSTNITGLSPQTSYTLTAYSFASATNCYNTTSAPASTVFTLSEAVSSQANSALISNATSSSLQLDFTGATFPGSGATQAGYVIIYSTGTPTLASTNGTAPAAGNGTIFTTSSVALPTTPGTSVIITGLSGNTTYNFLVIPYTWDGTNSATYNYLTASAPTASGTTLSLVAPSISSPSASGIQNTIATLGGNVTNDGGATISQRGIVWSSSNTNPVIGGIGCSTVTTSGTTGIFTTAVTGLPSNTTIYFAAFATNSVGTSYTTVSSFTTNSPATHLVFGSNPPANGNVGQNLVSFTVEARRANNTVDDEFSGVVTLNQISGTGLMTGGSVTAVSGVATFNTVQFNAASTYTIQGSAAGLTSTNVSNSIVVVVPDDAAGEWINTGSTTAWYTASNWSNNTIPSGAMFARFNNTGTATICGVNVNTGSPSILGIEMSSLRTRALSIGASVTTSGTLTLNGGLNNQLPNTIIRNASSFGLSFVPNVSSSGSLNLVLGNTTENVIRIDGTGNVTISSVISGSGRNLTKAGTGSGKLLLSGSNTYTGETRLLSGVLEIGASERIDNTSNILLNGGTLSTGSAVGFTETVGTLNLVSNSSIQLGTGLHDLIFAASNAISWSGNTLTVFGWTGTYGTSGTSGRIFVGNSAGGLTPAQLSKINFDGYPNGAMQLPTGEVVPKTDGPTSSVLSGTGTICNGSSTPLTVAISGGTAPYTVVYSNGTSNVTVSNYTSGTAIPVSPASNTTYTLVSVTDAASWIGIGNSGSAIVTVNGLPLVFNTPTVTASSVTLTWPLVSGAAWYEFQYKETASGTWISAGTLVGTGSTRTIQGLNPNTSYDFRGRTFCTNNAASSWSTIVTTSTANPISCELPPVLTTASLTGTTATITWPAVVGAAWYEFRYKPSSSGTWISAGTLSGSSIQRILTGLTSATQYDFQARTYCASGVPNSWSASLQFTTSAAVGCETAPVLTVASVSNTSATITWPAISGAAWYEFRYKLTSSTTWISAGTLTGTATSRTLTGLTANSQYDFQARTFCANGNPSSAWSATRQFTTTGAAAIALVEGNVIESSEGQSTKEMAINEASGVAVNVFPNPTDDLVQVQVIMEQANETLVVRMFDMSGRLVQEAQAMTEGGLTTIPLSMGEMMTGMYNVELYQNGALIHRARVQKN